jgi:hypothetical protein
MPVTLTEAKKNAATALDLAVIDEFRTNPLMDLMVFDDAVNPVGGGATLTYGYRRLITTATAAFRAYNAEYTPGEVSTAQYFTDLKPLGGSFQVDRILAKVGAAATNAVTLNMQQKIKATKAKFGDAVINGDVTVDANGFDGLSKALAGSSTESTTAIDWTGTQDTTWGFKVLATLDDLLSMMDGDASIVLGNRKAINLIRAAARLTSMYTREPGPRNSYVERYGPAVLQEAGLKDGSASDVVPVNASDPDGAGPLVAGSTSLYAVRIGIDGFHAVSTAGGQLVQTWLPDFTTAGAVKTGEVELGPVSVALKATKAAAVMRNVKVQ